MDFQQIFGVGPATISMQSVADCVEELNAQLDELYSSFKVNFTNICNLLDSIFLIIPEKQFYFKKAPNTP